MLWDSITVYYSRLLSNLNKQDLNRWAQVFATSRFNNKHFDLLNLRPAFHLDNKVQLQSPAASRVFSCNFPSFHKVMSADGWSKGERLREQAEWTTKKNRNNRTNRNKNRNQEQEPNSPGSAGAAALKLMTVVHNFPVDCGRLKHETCETRAVFQIIFPRNGNCFLLTLMLPGSFHGSGVCFCKTFELCDFDCCCFRKVIITALMLHWRARPMEP